MLKTAFVVASVASAALLPNLAQAEVYVVDYLNKGATTVFVNTNIPEPSPVIRQVTVVMVYNGQAIANDIKQSHITYQLDCSAGEHRAIKLEAYDINNKLALRQDNIVSPATTIQAGTTFETIKKLACATPQLREAEHGKRKLPDDKIVGFADYLFNNPD